MSTGKVSAITLMSHFARADECDSDFTSRQIARFDSAAAGLPGPRSLANSAGVLHWPGARRDWGRCGIALYGAGDLAEIAMLSAGETGIEIVCVIDEDKPGRRLAGRLIVANLEAAQIAAGASGLDGVIVTDTTAPQLRFEALLSSAAASGLAAGRILAPDLLGISQQAMPVPLRSIPSRTTGEEKIAP